jgi:hypothetical protein
MNVKCKYKIKLGRDKIREVNSDKTYNFLILKIKVKSTGSWW